MSDNCELEKLVANYCRAWFAPEAEERRRLLAETFEPDGVYVDPTVRIEGADVLLAHIAKVVASRPGFFLERTSIVDTHHDFLRFSWVQRRENGYRGGESMDVCQLSPRGRLKLVVGFFGPLSPL